MKFVTTREACEIARNNNSVAGLFVIKNMEGVQGVLSAAQKTNSPVILGISGRDFKSIDDIESFILYIRNLVYKMDVPVALHFDHGGEQSIQQILKAIKLGFTGVMYDASNLPLEKNISIIKKIVEICHSVDISVEGAIGQMRAFNCGEYEEGEMDLDNFVNKDEKLYYTIPEEAKIFAEETGVDIIAVSVGTVHGLPNFKVKIDTVRLEEIRKRTPALISIHGGSGTPEDEVIKLVKGGVSKINIGADLYKAITEHVRKLVVKNNVEMIWNFRLSRVIEDIATKYMNLYNCFKKY